MHYGYFYCSVVSLQLTIWRALSSISGNLETTVIKQKIRFLRETKVTSFKSIIGRKARTLEKKGRGDGEKLIEWQTSSKPYRRA